MRRTASVLVALGLALAWGGCGEERPSSRWNIVAEIEAAERGHVVAPPKVAVGAPLRGVKDEELPCLTTCHSRAKWANEKPYPHLKDAHKNNGKHCIDCHAMGHRSAKSDRRICKECH
jgi:hypothetical protein